MRIYVILQFLNIILWYCSLRFLFCSIPNSFFVMENNYFIKKQESVRGQSVTRLKKRRKRGRNKIRCEGRIKSV